MNNERSMITAVIVNWNRSEDIVRLLDSIALIDYKLLNIVVVDNASTDDSVEAIKNHEQDVILIENQSNLGGTGGFNTGVRHALEHLEQDYIWLLDNDATVDPGALTALVSSMNMDPLIAVAGSKILNAHDPAFIVETGANIDWRTASVIPINRNIPNIDNEPAIMDVEYVAICSALLRVTAIRKIGLMDERYFLLWDDMDWGVSFKQAGYRVVAVNDSLIYHPPFTEKRSLAVDNYYGIRNPLLTASKKARGISLLWAVFTLCRSASRKFCLACLDCQSYAKRLSILAIVDFLFNRWGKLAIQPDQLTPNSEQPASVLPWSSLRNGKILVLNSGTSSEINDAIKSLEKNCGDSVVIDMVIQADRKGLFKIGNLGEIIEVDFETKNALLRNFRIFWRLRNKQYMLAVNPSLDRTSPFAFVAPSLVRYDSASCSFKFQNTHSFWKVFLLLVVSELAALVCFPFVLLRAYAYGMER